MVVTWDYVCAGQGNKQVNSSCVGSPPASGLLITRGGDGVSSSEEAQVVPSV